MVDYEELSDFEVDKAVAEALGKYAELEEDGCWLVDPPNDTSGLNPSERLGMTEGGSRILAVLFEPCANCSDAWPIIVENGICLESGQPITKAWEAYRYEFVPPDSFDKNCISYGKNPLRAAMVCFLKMKESA